MVNYTHQKGNVYRKMANIMDEELERTVSFFQNQIPVHEHYFLFAWVVSVWIKGQCIL